MTVSNALLFLNVVIQLQLLTYKTIMSFGGIEKIGMN